MRVTIEDKKGMEVLTAAAQFFAAIGTLTLAVLTYTYVRSTRRMAETNRQMVEEMRESRLAQDKPHVVVEDEHSDNSAVDLVVRNMGNGAAYNIQFDFSNTIEGYDGRSVSNLGYFSEGLDFLAPGAEVRCFWGMSFNIIPKLKNEGLSDGIQIVADYESSHGQHFSTRRTINPVLFEYQANIRIYGIHDLAKSFMELSKKLQKAIHMGEINIATREERRRDDRRIEKAMREQQEQDKTDEN
jgi:hypothetical protein